MNQQQREISYLAEQHQLLNSLPPLDEVKQAEILKLIAEAVESTNEPTVYNPESVVAIEEADEGYGFLVSGDLYCYKSPEEREPDDEDDYTHRSGAEIEADVVEVNGKFEVINFNYA